MAELQARVNNPKAVDMTVTIHATVEELEHLVKLLHKATMEETGAGWEVFCSFRSQLNAIVSKIHTQVMGDELGGLVEVDAQNRSVAKPVGTFSSVYPEGSK